MTDLRRYSLSACSSCLTDFSIGTLSLAPPICRGTSWLPVVGCEHVGPPLLACDLTLALSDHHQRYLANVTGLLEGWTPSSALLEDIDLIRDSKIGRQPNPTPAQSPLSPMN